VSKWFYRWQAACLAERWRTSTTSPFDGSEVDERKTGSALCRQRDGFSVTLAFRHHSPGHARDLVGERDGCDLCWSPHARSHNGFTDGFGIGSVFFWRLT
jgi:hypothetical protein